MTDEELNICNRIYPIFKDLFGNSPAFIGEMPNNSLYPNKYGIRVKKDGTKYVVLCRTMYDNDLNVSFEMLEELSKFFDTKDINLSDKTQLREGCGSCGYRGCYGVEIFIKTNTNKEI
jgi:hypothetical protein